MSESVVPLQVGKTVESNAASSSVSSASSSIDQASDLPHINITNESVGRRLKSIVSGLSAPFCCGGTLQLSVPPHVMTLTAEGEVEDTVIIKPPLFWTMDYVSQDIHAKYLKQQPELLRSLIDKAQPAAFGKGQETVIDPAVRLAKQLPASAFYVNIQPQLHLKCVLACIQDELGLHTDLVAEPYSLNIYETGGLFVKHKDTPRGEDMVGTLVLCLPSLFRGGKLTLEMGDEKSSYFGKASCQSWLNAPIYGHEAWWQRGPESYRQADATQIPWCAFFSDVDHQVHEVTQGVRITLSYLLRRKDGSSASTLIPRTLANAEQKTAALVAALRKLLANKNFLSEGGKIAFPCEHLYGNQQVYHDDLGAQGALSLGAIQNLKGRDLMVAQAASIQTGLKVHLNPLVTHADARLDRGDYYMNKFPIRRRVPDRMSDRAIQLFFKSTHQSDPDGVADVWIQNVGDGAREKYGECQWNPEGYFGNEASVVEFYVQCVLLIHVPSYEARRRLTSL